MRRLFQIIPLTLLVFATTFGGVASSRAQTLLQDLDPGSVTEGAFADLFYYPEPRTVDQLTPPRPSESRQKSAAKHKNRSSR